jgi:hypothetical protein
LIFPKEDLGFIYTNLYYQFRKHEGYDSAEYDLIKSGAFVDLEESIFRQKGCFYNGESSSYLPSSIPGGRLPHIPFLLKRSCGNWCLASSVDVDDSLPTFVLFYQSEWWKIFWEQVTQQVEQARGITWPVKYTRIMAVPRTSLNVEAITQIPSDQPECPFVYCASEDLAEAWQFPESSDSAILVRPDGHIMWRSLGTPPLEDMSGVVTELVTFMTESFYFRSQQEQ